MSRGQTLASISSTLGGGEDVATLDLAISEASIARDAAAREVARMNQLVEAEAVPARRLDEARTSQRLAEAQRWQMWCATRDPTQLPAKASSVSNW